MPVRLETLHTGGLEEVFVGCYILRLVQLAVQEPPFVPLGGVGSRLRSAQAATSPKLPRRGSARATRNPDELDTARACITTARQTTQPRRQ
ncbi:MAG: hypothetical protein AVDCRST_MAG86-914 [uncultured Truepera sp.]|uniref:Uncharacterized protein n=1 Tax=uncultured Truepera sp. TaxID=543023 RepID=A0A6J4V4F6_9DEIN|nr:MAG: hypothetical protein AVDCRST_MAG86-914 [uncultured Truepera sp.]